MSLPAKLQAIAKEIAKREGKKSQVKIGDIREVLKALAEMQAEEFVENAPGKKGPMDHMLDYALKIYEKKAKKKA